MNRETAIQSATVFMFQQMAEAGEIDNATIAAHAALFDPWDKKEGVQQGCIRLCPETEKPFRCIESPNPKARTAPKPPSKDTAKWEAVTA